jgi:serine/threonine protein kinase
MAYVYRGHHLHLEERVAIKVLFPEFLRRKSIRARFKREARLQFQLNHPNIVRVLDFFEEERLLGMVLDWVEGGDLSTFLDVRRGPLPPKTISRLFLPVLDGVQHAHNKGIIHRDLKPHNIMLDGPAGEEEPKVMDFGVAWSLEDDGFHTKTGVVLGTPYYLSPEQSTGTKKLDHRSDIYSLGIILFQMLTGHFPFVGESAVEVISGHCFRPPPSIRDFYSDYTVALEEIVNRALAKQPEDRFQSCEAFRKALQSELPSLSKIIEAGGVFRSGTGERQAFVISREEVSTREPIRKTLPSVDLLDAVGPIDASDPNFASAPPELPGNRMSFVFWWVVTGGCAALLAGLAWWGMRPTTHNPTERAHVKQAKKRAMGRRSVPVPMRVAPRKPEGIVPRTAPIRVVKKAKKMQVMTGLLKRPIVPKRRMVAKRTTRRKVASIASLSRCRRCVNKSFAAIQKRDLMGHNSFAIGGSCNRHDYLRTARRCRRQCGSFSNYCRAFLSNRIGKCQHVVREPGILRSLRRTYRDAAPAGGLHCLRNWR